MQVTTNWILPVLLLFGDCVNNIRSEDELKLEGGGDPMLDKIATDVAEDFMQVFVPAVDKYTKHQGPPKAPAVRSELNADGISFHVKSKEGQFRGFPTLHINGNTTLHHFLAVMDDDGRPHHTHMVFLRIPITFRNFEIHYEKINMRNSNNTWPGKLTLHAKKNGFILNLRIKHKKGEACKLKLFDIESENYGDAELTIKSSKKDIYLKHLDFKKDVHLPVDDLIRQAFLTYLGKDMMAGSCEYEKNRPRGKRGRRPIIRLRVNRDKGRRRIKSSWLHN